jgi:hypothetical protein
MGVKNRKRIENNIYDKYIKETGGNIRMTKRDALKFASWLKEELITQIEREGKPLESKELNCNLADVKKGVAELLICCGTCQFMNDGECDCNYSCTNFNKHAHINGF